MKKNNKKYLPLIIFLSFVIIGIIIFILIPDDENYEAIPEKSKNEYQSLKQLNDGSTWTVMLFMCGSDLESEQGCATFNINQCLEAENSDRINVVIETGGCSEWQTDSISDENINRFLVEDGELVLKDETSLSSMGESSTLSEFILWSKENYPADKYALILWDHGGGSIYGIMSDDNYDNDSLSLNELSTALKESGTDFNLIGFDACLMATLETAEVCKDYGKYFVASEESEVGSGWDYTSLLNEIARNPGDDGSSLGKLIVDSFYEQCKSMEAEDTATLSLIDLSKLPALSTAFSGLSLDFLQSTHEADRLQEISQAVEEAENYGGNNPYEGYFNMVDIGDMADKTLDIFETNASAVKNALSDAVIYERHGDSRAKSTGLSVFYPLYIDDDIYNSYLEVSDNLAYLEYISIVNNSWQANDWDYIWNDIISGSEDNGYEYENISEGLFDYIANDEDSDDTLEYLSQFEPVTYEDDNISFSQYLDEGNNLHLDITSGLDYVKSVNFNIFMEDEDTGEYYFLGIDNDLFGDYEQGTFQDNFTGTWLSIDEYPVCVILVEAGEGYNIYSVPAIVNGKETNLRITYNYSTGEYKVLGSYTGMDKTKNICSKDLTSLKAGDEITFLFTVLNLESDEDETAQGGSIVWNNDNPIEELFLNDGNYYYMFEVNDIFGNSSYGDPVEMTILEGDIYVNGGEE